MASGWASSQASVLPASRIGPPELLPLPQLLPELPELLSGAQTSAVPASRIGLPELPPLPQLLPEPPPEVAEALPELPPKPLPELLPEPPPEVAEALPELLPKPLPESLPELLAVPLPARLPEPLAALLPELPEPPETPEPEPEPLAASTPASANCAHLRMETRLVSIVTAPLRARVLPLTFAPVSSVMLVSARILPLNAVVVPRVAELPTCQKILQSCAPLMTRTDELLAVVSVLPI